MAADRLDAHAARMLQRPISPAPGHRHPITSVPTTRDALPTGTPMTAAGSAAIMVGVLGRLAPGGGRPILPVARASAGAMTGRVA